MKKALISPLEPCFGGYRVAQVSQDSFEVAKPLFWVDCEDTVEADVYYFDQNLAICVLAPEPEIAPTQSSGTLQTVIL